MKAIKVELPKTLERIDIHAIADLHIGDAHCDMQAIKGRIQAVADDPNAYIILNGDIINNAIKSSVSDSYAEALSPMDQINRYVSLFEGVKDRIIAVTQGNHEARTYREDGVDISRLCARQLGIEDRYADTGALIFLSMGQQGSNGHFKPYMYTIYATHGCGGGRKEGGKVIRLADLASIVDADIYLMSHTHLPVTMREAFYRVDVQHCTAVKVDKLFVNTSAMLDYGGYGESKGFKPSSIASPVIHLSGKKKAFGASL